MELVFVTITYVCKACGATRTATVQVRKDEVDKVKDREDMTCFNCLPNQKRR